MLESVEYTENAIVFLMQQIIETLYLRFVFSLNIKYFNYHIIIISNLTKYQVIIHLICIV